MKSIFVLSATVLLLTGCQQQASSPEQGKAAQAAALPADASTCDRYAAFVEDYAAKQDPQIAKALLDRLNYDKQRWKIDDKQQSEAYCKQSLERMERLAG
jgi:outer membrane murein-binding lipoprotein Lpp